MRAGKLQQQIVIQSKTATRDATGQAIETWSELDTVWAEAITGGGKEFYAAQKLYAETQVVFKIRYNSAFTTLHRVKWLDRTYEILSVEHVSGLYREMMLVTKEVV